MDIQQQNFKALAKIVDMEAIQAFNFEAAKSESRGYMDLNFDYLFATDADVLERGGRYWQSYSSLAAEIRRKVVRAS